MNTEQLAWTIVSIAMSTIAIVCSSIAITMRVNDRKRWQTPPAQKNQLKHEPPLFQHSGWTTIESKTTYKPSGKRNKKREHK
jgi:hypothetical protein